MTLRQRHQRVKPEDIFIKGWMLDQMREVVASVRRWPKWKKDLIRQELRTEQ